VRTKTIAAINSYQFAVPDLRGMFLRGADFAGLWDLDNVTRFGFGIGVGGANYGTYEYQQFLSHTHNLLFSTVAGGIATLTSASASANATTFATGGSETRPVNAYVNWVMKY
jgi:hypothetical protein